MPELPEVETVVRGLSKHIIGQKIIDIEQKHKKSLLLDKNITSAQIKGLKVLEIKRRGKGIIINLTKNLSLLIHLKMTGQLIYISNKSRLHFGHPTDDFTNSMPSKHTRVIIKFFKGILYFNDQRLFGWVKILPTQNLTENSFLKSLGPEPLDKSFTTDVLWQIIKRKPKSTIKAIILDQSNLVGIGNIYADETLFEAGIRPDRKASSIKKVEAEKLVKAIKKVLKKGIKYSGTSIINYKTPEGSPGRMQNYLKVYSQDKKLCQKCKTPIKKIRTASRGTHYCPTCQK